MEGTISNWRRYRLTFVLALAFSAENADLGVLRQWPCQ